MERQLYVLKKLPHSQIVRHGCLAASLQSRPQHQPAVAVFSVTEVSDDLMEI
jgi:hypothetical protein